VGGVAVVVVGVVAKEGFVRGRSCAEEGHCLVSFFLFAVLVIACLELSDGFGSII
jgi:hypothetical protein